MSAARRLGLLAALALTACGVPETGDPPPTDEMYFPVGLAPHPDGRYLYIANAGFDRRYNAGTLEVFDTWTRRLLPEATLETGLFAGELLVTRFGRPHVSVQAPDAAIAAGAGTFTLTVKNEGGGAAEEVGVLVRLAGAAVATPCAGEDPHPGSPRGSELRFRIPRLGAGETATLCGGFTCADATCPTGAATLSPALTLGGDPYETPAGAPVRDQKTIALLTTRENDRLTWFEIDAARADAPGHLVCSAEGGAECDESHEIRSLQAVANDPDMGASPYGIALDASGFYLTHVKRGELSRWRFGDATSRLFEPEGICRLTLSGGASSVARHPLLGWAYVTDRGGQAVTTVATLDPLDRGTSGRISTERCRLEERAALVVDPDAGEGRTRGLAFSGDGTVLYVATGSDTSLHVYDASIGPNGRPRHLLLGAIPLGAGPNVVRVAGLRPGELRASDGIDRGAVGAAVDARGQGLVYVSTFDSDELLVVDPVLMAVVARVPTGTGPHEIAFLPDAEGHLQAWVANFRDHSLTLVDIDPDSPRRFTAVANLR